jgi:hypothetical protein
MHPMGSSYAASRRNLRRSVYALSSPAAARVDSKAVHAASPNATACSVQQAVALLACCFLQCGRYALLLGGQKRRTKNREIAASV